MSNTIQITRDNIYKFKNENTHVLSLLNVKLIDEEIDDNGNRFFCFSAYSTRRVRDKNGKYCYNENAPINFDNLKNEIYHIKWNKDYDEFNEWIEDGNVYNFDAKFISAEIVNGYKDTFSHTVFKFMEIPESSEIIEKRNYEKSIESLKIQNENLMEILDKMENKLNEIYHHIGCNKINRWD